MPATRIELRQGQVITVDGLPVTLVYPFCATIAVAGRDDDGCPDPPATLLTVASQWRRRFYKNAQSDYDGGNSRSVS